MKRYYAFPQRSSITGTSHSNCLMSYNQNTRRWVLPLCICAVSVFLPRGLGKISICLHTVIWLYELLYLRGTFLSLRGFGLLSSSLLLFPQRFGFFSCLLNSGSFTELRTTSFCSVKVPKFDKHMKKSCLPHIGRNVVEITIKMKIIVWNPLMMKIIKLHLRNLDNLGTQSVF